MAHELGYDLADAIKRQNISKENIAAIRDTKLPHVPDNVTDKMVRFNNCCSQYRTVTLIK